MSRSSPARLPLLARLIGDRRGTMIPLIGFALAIGVSAAALGIDYTRARALQQSLELAADAAALAAAQRLPDVDAARNAALAYVEKNMPSAKYGKVLDPADVEMGQWDSDSNTFILSTGSEPMTAVRVSTRLTQSNGNPVSTFFGAAFGFDTLDVSTSATAGRAGAPCLMTLDPINVHSMRTKSKATLEAKGCGVQVNSTALEALQLDGNSKLEAGDICVGGTAQIAGSSTIDPSPREYCPGQADPLAGLVTIPSHSICDHTDASYSGSTLPLSPGVYCGGLEITDGSDITLDPGTYVIVDGPLQVTEASSLSGDEVTIVLTGSGAGIHFDDNSFVDLTAPKSGTYQGFLFIQDPDYANDHVWDGNAVTNLVGVVYLPTGKLTADSGNQVTPYQSCTVLITKDLEIINESSLSIDLSSSSCRQVLPTPYRRAVVLLQ